MKSKEYIILGIIVVLLGTYLFLRRGDRTHYELPHLPDVTTDAFSRIDITTSAGTISLTRNEGQWWIGESRYPVDASKIKSILSTLADMKLTALVSETGSYSRYDLTDDKRIGVQAWAGDRLVRDIAIGKVADTYRHTFVRIGDSPDVYHAQNSIRQTFDQTVDGLRDKTALSFDASEISAIDIVSGEQHLTLTRVEASAPPATEDGSGETVSGDTATVWMRDDGVQVDADAIQKLLSQLAYLTCSGYLDDKKKEDFQTPSCMISVKGETLLSLSLFTDGSPQAGCAAISSQNAYPFTLNETTCSRLLENVEKLSGTQAGGGA